MMQNETSLIAPRPVTMREEASADAENSALTGESTSAVIAKEAERNNDEKLVVFSRIFVVAVLTMVTLIIAVTTYHTISQDEHEDFVAEFEASARQVALMATRNAENVYTSIETLSTMYPAATHESGERLPMVTIGNFEELGAGARKLSKITTLFYSPLLATETDLSAWNEYSVNHSEWISHGASQRRSIERVYHVDNATGRIVTETGSGPFAPLWQASPLPHSAALVNLNLVSNAGFAQLLMQVVMTGQRVLSKPMKTFELLGTAPLEGSVSLLVQPVHTGSKREKASENLVVAGFLTAIISWVDFFASVLPPGQDNIVVVMDSCGVNNTFVLHGSDSVFKGTGDLHNPLYDAMGVRVPLDFGAPKQDVDSNACSQTAYIFPTDELEQRFGSSNAFHYSAVVVAMFIFTGTVFMIYDVFVSNRQARTERKADSANAIVEELFPGVAEKLFESKDDGHDDVKKGNDSSHCRQGRTTTIAELHPAATVLFADIAGFTAWSSMRDPNQVFTLLEAIFQAFDAIAKKRGIFKVETIGDCYVAVCGVPKANPMHAVCVCRFARTAMEKFDKVIRSLELKLGPDTVDLGMRVGIHSGPVTSGVLRAERARFQLFGDTVNTASRIESSGIREKIHLSEQTAQELVKQGKEDWIVKRDDAVEAKGKGKLVTFWLKLNSERAPSDWSESEDSERESETMDPALMESQSEFVLSQGKRIKERRTNLQSKHQQRLVDWNSELLTQLLEQVVAHRKDYGSPVDLNLDDVAINIGQSGMVVDEVTDFIDLPLIDPLAAKPKASLDAKVTLQLRQYVAKIASLYNNDNTFHNFEHASHVTMSASKLLSRIIEQPASRVVNNVRAADQSCGIKTDPLSQFSIVLAALIHDVDHSGVSNAQLVDENPILANLYGNRSVAEQNSVEVAWKALLSTQYDDLRAAIFSTEAELRRFRQIMVNGVIATDIFDEDLAAIRKDRWSLAFSDVQSAANAESSHDTRNLKCAIILESLMQASDVAHTMQHWQVYQKWNQRLFEEMLTAFRNGRNASDPIDGWYEGELKFFDNYVIPLAHKLTACGTFGASGEEYLAYAQQNRSEWAAKGQGMVQSYLADFEKKPPLGRNSTGRGTGPAAGGMIRRGSVRMLTTARKWFTDSDRSLGASFASS